MDKITRREEVKKRQPLYLPGDPSSNVYLLKRGRVKIANTAPNGKEVIFDSLEAGDVFGIGYAGITSFTSNRIDGCDRQPLWT